MALTIPNDTTTFIPARQACDTPFSQAGAITTSPARKTPANAPKTADDELFSGSFVPSSKERLEKVFGLMERHGKILSITRSGTKTLENTFLRLRQLVKGEFLYAYTWDRNWFNRVSKNYPLEKFAFETEDDLFGRLEDVLGYIEERQSFGYWYPTKRNGKAEKVSLANFLASPTKNGAYWSPFMEIACGDVVTPRMYRSALGSNVCAVLDKILERVWFQKDFQTMLKFYKGVLDLKKWHDENVAGLVEKCSANNYNLSAFCDLLDRVRQCNEETGCVCPTFIGPWSGRWCVFKNWLNKNYGVMI